jgi:tRNA(Arg) A34 adenosine deaminase TadA
VLPDWVFDDDDRRFMARALEQARRAGDRGEVPVGCVVVRAGEVVAECGNRRRELADPSAHAEILALRAAGAALRDWRLAGCTLYVTLEPCPMCTTASRQARLELLVWGAEDTVAGACGSVVDLAEDPRLGPPLAHRGGLAAEEARQLLRSFFAKTRGTS